MAVINVFAADTDEEARFVSTSMQQAFAAVVRGRPGLLPPPVADIDAVLGEAERAAVRSRLRHAAIGGPETVRRQIADFIALTGVDELMVTGMIFDPAARIRSLEIAAEAMT